MIAVISWHLLSPKLPEYGGKSLDEWMKRTGTGRVVYVSGTGTAPSPARVTFGVRFPKGRSKSDADECRAAMKSMGTNTLPFLQPMLLARDGTIRDRLEPWIKQSSWIEERFPTPLEQRQRAVAAISMLGEDALPFLTGIFEDEQTPADVRAFAAYVFRRYPGRAKGSLKALKTAQRSPDPLLALVSSQATEAIEKGTLAGPPSLQRAASGLIPMARGTEWIYEGHVEWTVPGMASVESTNLHWTAEVIGSYRGRYNAEAAIVRGFVNELAWYTPGQTPALSVLLSVSNCVYWIKVGSQKEAEMTAQELAIAPHNVPRTAELLLEWPLIQGKRWGGDANRTDNFYCWYVEEAKNVQHRVPGFQSYRPVTTYTIAYRTNPDHQLVEIVPDLGFTHYVYGHHGTVASADVRLISFKTPETGAKGAK